MNCGQCGAELARGQKFCGQCGARATLPQTTSAEEAPDGERRHLTILFSDIVGSTEIAARLDPEEWRDIAAAYQRCAAEAMAQFGGHVAQYLGDGVVVYFGWPAAQEDDAQRAVRAGLALVEAVSQLSARLPPHLAVKLSVRVGIDSGSVVIGQGGGREIHVFGETPNIASRVQSLAEPDTVIVTRAVHDLISEAFVVKDLGAHALKGVDRPLRLYRAIQPDAERHRGRRSAVRALTPFVGRDAEMRLLWNRWGRAREGAGQLVLLSGEPGIGKSRLVEEFRARLASEPHRWLDASCERFFENTPFHVVRQMLDQALGWAAAERENSSILALERSLTLAELDLSEAVPLVAELLGLPIPEPYSPPAYPPDQRRRRLLAIMARWVINLARRQPMVIAMEDLHWIDPSTLELARMLVEQASGAPLLLLFTAREAFRPPWPAAEHCLQIEMGRLSDVDTRALIAGLGETGGLSRDVIDTLIERTDGVPLFAEELTRLVLDSDGHSASGVIPATLHDSLTARLDRLGPAREVARMAAILGRDFSYALLSAALGWPEQALRDALEVLAEADLIYARGLPPAATYQFKHALTRDAAYEGLLRSRRRELHRLVARTIVERFPALARDKPELLARHWTEAGDAEPATACWKAAGDIAYARRAFKEAEEAYRQANGALLSLPPSRERDGRELVLCGALVQVRQLTRGYSAPETVESGARARALAEQIGDLDQLVRQEVRTWRALFVTGDYAGAAALAERILQLTRQGAQTQGRLLFAHNEELQGRFYTGDLAGVEEHYARLSPLIQAAGQRQAPGNTVISIGITSLAAWVSGRPDDARERMHRAGAFARESGNPYDMAMALLFEAYLHRFRREFRQAGALAGRMLVISDDHGFSYAADLARGVLGWARAHQGDTSFGVRVIEQAVTGLNQSGAKVGITDVLMRLAEAHRLDGAPDRALASIEAALSANPQERIFTPHILAFRGALRWDQDDLDGAEDDYRAAIAMAGDMGATAWALRAAVGLARLLASRGDPAAGRSCLGETCALFADELADPELGEARDLLGQLGSGDVDRRLYNA